MELFDYFSQLVAARSQSGNEKAAAEVIRKLASPFADDIASDALGNLIVHKKGPGKKMMLAAHMDEIGFIVTGVEEGGFLRAAPVGGIYSYEMLGVRVVFSSGVAGVIYKEDKISYKELKSTGLYIDIGAKSGEEALSRVQVGDCCGFADAPVRMGSRWSSPYMDDKMGCAILLSVLEGCTGCGFDAYFVFTVQEELGLRGAGPAAFGVAPDYAVAVDVCDTSDTPGNETHNKITLGGGPACTVLNRSYIAHPHMRRLIDRAAEQAGLTLQHEVTVSGGTDAGAIHTSRGGVPSGGISIPTRYLHTPIETVEQSDVEGCVKLITGLLELGDIN